MDSFLAFISSPILGKYSALAVVVFIVYLFYDMHKSTKNNISLADLFLDPKTGKIGGSEFRLNTAFIVTSWALVYLTIKGTLTEWYIAAYLTAFVADRVYSRMSSRNFNNKGIVENGQNTQSTENTEDSTTTIPANRTPGNIQ
jgi:hypothetical protein